MALRLCQVRGQMSWYTPWIWWTSADDELECRTCLATILSMDSECDQNPTETLTQRSWWRRLAARASR